MLILLVLQEVMQKFLYHSFTPSRLFWVSDKDVEGIRAHESLTRMGENGPPLGLAGFPNFFLIPNLFFVTRNSVQNFKSVAQLLLG